MVCVGLRRFSTFQPKSFDWRLSDSTNLPVEFSFLPHSPSSSTVVLIPSFTLASSKEEWRPCARKLYELGFNTAIVELPGFALTQGSLNAALLTTDRPMDTFNSYLSQFFDFMRENTGNSRLNVVAAGGQTAAIAAAALEDSASQNFRLISLAPEARQYLRADTAVGFPRRLARKQQRLYSLLTDWNIVRKIFQSSWFMRKLSRNLYESEISPDRFMLHHVALARPGVDWNFHAAVYCGYLDVVKATDQLAKSIMFLEDERNDEDPNTAFDTDEEDDVIFNARPLPLVQKISIDSWRPSSFTKNAGLILPGNFRGFHELEIVARKFSVPTVKVAGRLHCHEEFPGTVAEAIATLVNT